MLKFRVNILRYGVEIDEEIAQIFSEIPYFDFEQGKNDEDDIEEATALAALLVGVWLGNLFRYPTLMMSSNSQYVNPVIIWCSKLIFEHLMSLKRIPENTFSAVGDFLDLKKIN